MKIKEYSISNNTIALFIIAVIGIIASYYAIVSIGYDGGADTLGHYIISRYALQKPDLLLSIWGRPIFSLFGIPFALLGFTAMKFYTVLAGLLSGWLAYLTIKKLGYSQPWMVIPMVLLAPIFFLLLISPLTETIMALMLIAAIWAFFGKRYFLAALLISFIPFARFEAFVVFPPFIIAFILRRQYKYILILPLGYLLFSIIGWIVFKDFLWLINLNPYQSGGAGLYGKGELLHFIYKTEFIQGIPLGILSLIGILFLTYRFFFQLKTSGFKSRESEILILVLGSVFAYYAAHSYAWYSGSGNSLGLIRMMAAVIPGTAILSFIGYSFLTELLRKIKIPPVFPALILIVLIIRSNNVYKYPVRESDEEKVLIKTADWIKNNKLDNRKLYYYNIFLGVLLNENPFNDQDGSMMIHFRTLTPENVPEEALLVWDSHFGANEGYTPLEVLLKDESLKLLKVIRPERPFTVLGNSTYEVCLFTKTNADKSNVLSNYITYSKTYNNNEAIVFAKFMGFESPEPRFNSWITNEMSFAGKRSLKTDSSIEFVGILNAKMKDLGNNLKGKLHASAWVKSSDFNTQNKILLVIHTGQGERYNYKSVSSDQMKPQDNGWRHLELTANLSNYLPEDDIKVYLWKISTEPVFIDNYSIDFSTDNCN